MAEQLPSIEIVHLSDLKQDPRNARKHNPRNVGMIVDSVHQVGAARSGVVDEDNQLMAGGATAEAMAEAGIERIAIVDTDGKTWVVVRRTGLSDVQKRRLALADNRAAELATWDPEILQVDYDAGLLDGLWFDNELEGLQIEAPPSLDDLADQYGEPEERNYWPWVRVQVEPATFALYSDLMGLMPGENEGEKFKGLLDCADLGGEAAGE